ncbi:thioesterase family protein [Sphingobium sufflavum]|uniref:thioesterase family protein n=1 Tax=Sphingobium sufflavum TaxID=1129547 RepID=UPI001F33B297|nr:thioesterase family protein [Sphingobium sufflavum]MCE7795344.1 thioesterase family protein [Sphingobium sufflavum]
MASLHDTIATLAPYRLTEGGEADAEAYRIEAPELWAQGRTLFGGMTAALSHAAIRRAHGDLGPLRNAQFTFVGPTTGPLSFRPALLRRGRSSAIVGVDCWNEDGLAARATFSFAGPRESAIAHDYSPRMDVPPPDACEPLHRTSKPLKGFLGQFEFRFAAGTRLFEGGASAEEGGARSDGRPEFAVWVRFREDAGEDPITALLAMADALPCAAMSHFPKPAPVSTLSWSVDVHQPLAQSGGWHLVWSSSEAAADGYSIQNMRVFNAEGVPLLSARQVVAIFI